MNKLRIYVASSWRNLLQPGIVLALRRCGHQVYDFRNPPIYCDKCNGTGRQWDPAVRRDSSPASGVGRECIASGCVNGVTGTDKGFSWSDIDPNWKNWTPAEYREALKHPIAKHGYEHDITALKNCDACVLVLPSGRSASWEFGYAMGQRKQGTVVQFDPGGAGVVEPELMYSEAEIVTTMGELFDAFGLPGSGLETPPAAGQVPFSKAVSIVSKAAGEVDDGVYYVDTDSVVDARPPVTPSAESVSRVKELLQPKIYGAAKPNCRACASCYLDDMDFICGHKDASTFGQKVNVAASSEGHCGPSLKKFVQHPRRTPDGGFK